MAKGKIPDFISSNNEILLLQFYENFRGIKSYALVCTQFPCSLNMPLGGGLKISEDTLGMRRRRHVSSRSHIGRDVVDHAERSS